MSIAEKLTTIAENQQKVYDAGKKAEYDAFWDSYQESGNRTQYNYSFTGIGWTMGTFKPKYDIMPINAGSMFYQSNISNLEEACTAAGIKFDTSKASNFPSTFYYTYINTIPEIDCRGCENTENPFAAMFRYSSIVTIRKMILPTNGIQTFSSTFLNAEYLQNISFEGVIGKDISFQYSPLSVESMKSVITHLYDYSTESRGTYTVKFTTACWDALEASGKPFDDGLTDDESLSWADYVQVILGWNI